MPIYEFRCESCGEEFEKICQIDGPLPDDCPSCDDPDIQKLISETTFKLKGSGWWETDYNQDNDAPEDAPRQDTGENEDSEGEAATTDDSDTEES